MELIKDFLSLKDKPNLPDLKNIEVKKEVIPYSLMKEVEIGYEKYYAFLRKNVPQTNLT